MIEFFLDVLISSIWSQIGSVIMSGNGKFPPGSPGVVAPWQGGWLGVPGKSDRWGGGSGGASHLAVRGSTETVCRWVREKGVRTRVARIGVAETGSVRQGPGGGEGFV